MSEASAGAPAIAGEELLSGSAGAPAITEGELPPGVLVARVGAGANCSSAGSAIDILFYTSVIAGAIAVALSAAFPPRVTAAGRGGAAGEGDGDLGGGADDAASGDDPPSEMR